MSCHSGSCTTSSAGTRPGGPGAWASPPGTRRLPAAGVRRVHPRLPGPRRGTGRRVRRPHRSRRQRHVPPHGRQRRPGRGHLDARRPWRQAERRCDTVRVVPGQGGSGDSSRVRGHAIGRSGMMSRLRGRRLALAKSWPGPVGIQAPYCRRLRHASCSEDHQCWRSRPIMRYLRAVDPLEGRLTHAIPVRRRTRTLCCLSAASLDLRDEDWEQGSHRLSCPECVDVAASLHRDRRKFIRIRLTS